MDAYKIIDGRYIQEIINISAANALVLAVPAVPIGKVWTILSCAYYPSVAETRTVYFSIISRSAATFPVTRPEAIALSNLIYLPMLTMGMELKLFPGEYINVRRDVATAGSTMSLLARFVENDLPYFEYEEPLKKVITQKFKHAGTFRVAIGGGGSPAGGEGAGGEGGGRERGGGGSEPI